MEKIIDYLSGKDINDKWENKFKMNKSETPTGYIACYHCGYHLDLEEYEQVYDCGCSLCQHRFEASEDDFIEAFGENVY